MTRAFGRVCALLLVCWPFAGLAQDKDAAPAGAGLLVSPTYVLLEGRTRSQSLLLVNRGTTPQTYRISIIDRRQMPDGQLVTTDKPGEGEGFASAMLRYAPHQIVLPPDKPQTVRLLLQMPSTLPDGEYRSHILFQEVPTAVATEDAATPVGPGVSLTIRAVFGVTIPIIVRKGNLTATASLSDLHVVGTGDGQQGLALRLNRAGTRSIRGDLVAKLDGTQIGILKNVNVFLSTPYRELTIPLSAPGDIKGRRLSVTFAEDEDIPGAASAAQTLAP
jgi:P pilus assembly chaperone PapD